MFGCSRDLKALPSNVPDILVHVHQLQSFIYFVSSGQQGWSMKTKLKKNVFW